jgi:hypothetical protein
VQALSRLYHARCCCSPMCGVLALGRLDGGCCIAEGRAGQTERGPRHCCFGFRAVARGLVDLGDARGLGCDGGHREEVHLRLVGELLPHSLHLCCYCARTQICRCVLVHSHQSSRMHVEYSACASWIMHSLRYRRTALIVLGS